MLKKYLIIFSSTVLCYAQDFNAEWLHIKNKFDSKQYDSVVIYIKPFKQNLSNYIVKNAQTQYLEQVGIANYYESISNLYLNKFDEAFLALDQMKRAFFDIKKNDKLKDLQNNISLILINIAKQQEKKSAVQAEKLYKKVLLEAIENNDCNIKVQVFYSKGLFAKQQNKSSEAIEDFENALLVLNEGRNLLPQVLGLKKNITTILSEIYLAMGEVDKANSLKGDDKFNKNKTELYISQAIQKINEKNYPEAEKLLSSIEDEIINTDADDRVYSYVQTRYRNLDLYFGINDAQKMLERIINKLGSINSKDILIFKIQNYQAINYLQKYDINNAIKVVDIMSKKIKNYVIPSSQEYLLLPLRGDIFFLKGEYEQAELQYKEALDVIDKYEAKDKLRIFSNLGSVLIEAGKNNEALRVFEKLYNAAENNSPEYKVLAELCSGAVLLENGDNNSAIEKLKNAQKIAYGSHDSQNRIICDLRLAEAYRQAGLDKYADILYSKIADNVDAILDNSRKIQALIALADYSISKNKISDAVNYLKTAKILAIKNGLTKYILPIDINLGDIYLAKQDFQHSKESYQKALEMTNTVDNSTLIMLRLKLSQIFLALDRTDSARVIISSSLKDLQLNYKSITDVDISDIKDANLYQQALAMLSSADYIESNKGNDLQKLLKAYDEIKKSLSISEQAKLLMKDVKEKLESNSIDAYKLAVDIAIKLYLTLNQDSYFEEAFNLTEKSRAEDFTGSIGNELLAKLNNPIINKVKEVTEKNKKKTIKKKLSITLATNQSSETSHRGMKVSALGNDMSQEEVKNILSLQKEYDKVLKDLNSQNSKESQLFNTITLQAIKKELSENEVVVNYFQSFENIYLFLIKKNDFQVSVINITADALGKKIDTYRSSIENIQNNEYMNISKELFGILLKPIYNSLENKKIILVPTGKLSSIPFYSLMKDNDFVGKHLDIEILPNLSLMQFVNNRGKLNNNPSLFAVGNPIPNESTQLGELPGTITEVTKLCEIYPNNKVVISNDATETTIKEQIPAYDIIHFACHGLFYDDYPLLSALALTPDSKNDGLLQLNEIYNLNLTNTKLVIMSACETGLSKIRKNDDMTGLVRGFFSAGVPSVVASLWKVDDVATSILMQNFHTNLRAGMSKSEALRKAQASLMDNPLYSHPYYWSSFVLFGGRE